MENFGRSFWISMSAMAVIGFFYGPVFLKLFSFYSVPMQVWFSHWPEIILYLAGCLAIICAVESETTYLSKR